MSGKTIIVAGAGLIGRRHIDLVTRHARVAAIVDPDPSAQALAAENGAPHFADLAECLAETEADGLIIATPNTLHVEQGLLAVERDLPMLIEKPIASTSADAERLVSASDAARVPVLVGHHRRHNPRVAAAKRFLDKGGVGRVSVVDGTFWLYKPDDYFDQSWRRSAGAGPVFINLIHDVDLLRHLCGEIVSVQAILSSDIRGFEVEDTAVVLLRFESGALGTFSASDTAVSPWSWEFTAKENPAYPHVPGGAYRIAGTHGALSVPDLVHWRHRGETSWWSPIEAETLASGDEGTFDAQMAHFLDVIDGATPLVTAAEALQSLRVVEAVIDAAKSGKAVAVSRSGGAR